MKIVTHKELLSEIAASLEYLKFSAGPKGHAAYEAYEHQVLLPATARLRQIVYQFGKGPGPVSMQLPMEVVRAIAATDKKLAESKPAPARPTRRSFY